MKNVIRLLTLLAIVATFALPALAQTAQPSPAAATDAEAKAALYERVIQNRKDNQAVAYEAGKEFLQKYGSENDEYVAYVRRFVTNYEKAKLDFDFTQALNTKNYAEAFRLGRQILSNNPNRTSTLVVLGWSGYLASIEGKDAFNNDAANYARQAVQLIESGRQPVGLDDKGAETPTWAPFSNREDALGGLYFALGSFATKANRPAEAAGHFFKAAQQNGFTKKEPNTYANLAGAYEVSEYKDAADKYRTMTQANPDAAQTPEAKALLAQLDQVSDRIIDAYARAIALATDAKYAPQKASWMRKLTALYKFRNNDSEAGLNELIASVLNKPMPAVVTTPATTPTTTETTPVQPTSGDANGARNSTAPTSTTTTTTTTTTTNTPATTQTGTKPKP